MNRNGKACFLLVILFIFMEHSKVFAVVPNSMSLEEIKTEEQTKEQRLEAIIEKLENQVQQNTEFLKNIKIELKQIKEGGR